MRSILNVPDQWLPIRTSLHVSLEPSLINPRVAGDTKCIRILYKNSRLTESEAIWMPTDSNKLPHYISFVVTCLKDVGHLINTGSFASQSTLIVQNILPTYRVQAADPGGREVWHRSAAAWLLGSRVRIPTGSWMFSIVFVVWRIGSDLCDGADHWCRGVLLDVCVCVCVSITDPNNEAS